jgi:hypothetical protein
MKTRINIIIAAIFAAFITTTHAGPSNWSGWATTSTNRITTLKAAEDCCKPDQKVALVCKDCKTITEKPGSDKEGILGWFKADSMHGCAGCSGQIVARLPSKRGPGDSYRHVCSKCGENSASICSSHKN